MDKLWSLCQRVVFSENFNFWPSYFCTVLMKEPTLALSIFTFLTNQTWFFALFVDTNIFSAVSVGAVWLFLKHAGHIKFIIIKIIKKIIKVIQHISCKQENAMLNLHFYFYYFYFCFRILKSQFLKSKAE